MLRNWEYSIDCDIRNFLDRGFSALTVQTTGGNIRPQFRVWKCVKAICECGLFKGSRVSKVTKRWLRGSSGIFS